MRILFTAAINDSLSDSAVYNVVKDLEGINWILPPEVFCDKDKYDEILLRLFRLIIKLGTHDLKIMKRSNETLTASNYLKKDANYIEILNNNWDSIAEGIKEIFELI